MDAVVKGKGKRYVRVPLLNQGAKRTYFKDIKKYGTLDGYVTGIVEIAYDVYEHPRYIKLLKFVLRDNCDGDDDVIMPFFTRGAVVEKLSGIQNGDIIVIENPYIEFQNIKAPVYHLAGDKTRTDFCVWLVDKKSATLLVGKDWENDKELENDKQKEGPKMVTQISVSEVKRPITSASVDSTHSSPRCLRSHATSSSIEVSTRSNTKLSRTPNSKPSPSSRKRKDDGPQSSSSQEEILESESSQSDSSCLSPVFKRSTRPLFGPKGVSSNPTDQPKIMNAVVYLGSPADAQNNSQPSTPSGVFQSTKNKLSTSKDETSSPGYTNGFQEKSSGENTSSADSNATNEQEATDNTCK